MSQTPERRKEYMEIYNKEYRKKKREILNEKSRKYRMENRDRINKNQRENWNKRRDKQNALNRLRKQEIKKKVFDYYGNKCICCGESHSEFLTIDHINGDGHKHRREISGTGNSLYRWLLKHNFPEGFRTLCFNCNCSIGTHGYCPHGNREGDTSFRGFRPV